MEHTGTLSSCLVDCSLLSHFHGQGARMRQEGIHLDSVVHGYEGPPGSCRLPLTAISSKACLELQKVHIGDGSPPLSPRVPTQQPQDRGQDDHIHLQCGAGMVHLVSLGYNMLLSALMEPECAGEPSRKPQILPGISRNTPYTLFCCLLKY